MTVWLAVDDLEDIQADLAVADVRVPQPPTYGPFEKVFTFLDPDGYWVTAPDVMRSH